jgi:thiamine biosynthesis protein ThiS
LTIRFFLNGEPHELAGPVTISALLAGLGIDPRLVAVEHNLQIVKRAKYEATMVDADDEVEVVNIVGGGEFERCSLIAVTY